MLNLRQPMRILLADDDPDERDLFEQVLKMMPFKYSFHSVGDGAELIKYVNACTDIPHILFLDLNMPKIQGPEALKVIRADKAFQKMVIAIYSTSSNKSEMEATLANGANCYIVKPPDFKVLRDTIERVLNAQWAVHISDGDIENFMISL